MWRNLAKQAYSRKHRFSANLLFPACSDSSNVLFQPGNITLLNQNHLNSQCPLLGSPQVGHCCPQKNKLARPVREFSWPQSCIRAYASVAEAIVSEEDSSSGCDEIQELIEEMNKQQQQQEQSFKQPKNMMFGMGVTKYHILRKRQVKMETEAWEEAAKEYQELLMDMCEHKLAPNLPYMKSLFLGWFEPLRDAIAADQEMCRQKRVKPSYAPFIDQLPADMMAVITMHKLMGLLMTTSGGNGSCRVVQAACQIGEAIEHEALLHKFLEKTKKKTTKCKTLDQSDSQTTENQSQTTAKEQKKLRNRVTQLMKKQRVKQVKGIVKAHEDSKPWGQENHVKIGCRLIQLLTETAYIQPPMDQLGDAPPDIRPAFVHALKTITKDAQKGSRRYGVIECDPLVQRGLEKTARHMVIPYMPMLVPPLNWKGYDKGAYLFLPSYIMRTHGARQQREAVKRAPPEKLEPVFEALDTLGYTKWRVNKRVLAVVDRIWANGGRLAGLVDREDVPLPEEPDTEDESEQRKWKWKVKNIKKENNERHSQRCDIELKLAVARKMKDEEGFYYPHNLDFRGRAYPMHPYLNHLGSDLCRGILEFAEGRPLGESGLRWLKIHLANLYAGGVDKLSYDGRIAFTENHIDDIFDSADRPLEGKRWWLGAEDPLQCLAACINLSEAFRSSSPESYPSYMPIHQDGSCNGLQHYAALGRDKLGAAAVNLIAGDKPADVYSGIAARVVEIMRRDAEKDPAKNPNAMYARLLINQVDRKLVKQTVMTSVYGVTYIGARDQIKRRLKERNFLPDDTQMFTASCYAAKMSPSDNGTETTTSDHHSLNCYSKNSSDQESSSGQFDSALGRKHLTETTLTALGEMFEAARSIMSWLGDCAKVIASENQPVRWTTPLGLPVVQPYRQLGRHLIKTSLQVLTLQRETDKVMVKRQRTAFPPNFVHSLDGSHMMMTAVACKKAGLNFAGVHDSYWTHACDVDKMNGILREKFVELYDAPILEDLLEGFEKSFPTLNFPPLPDRGDFDLKEVLESPYFFN